MHKATVVGEWHAFSAELRSKGGAPFDHLPITGIDAIDSGHLALVRCLSELGWAIESRCSKEIVRLFLMDFGELALRHFEQEEQLLARLDYPGLERHRAEHRALTRDLAQHAQAYAREGRSSAVETLAFLERWTFDHLMNADAEYLRYLPRT
jgi:hemerythrin